MHELTPNPFENVRTEPKINDITRKYPQPPPQYTPHLQDYMKKKYNDHKSIIWRNTTVRFTRKYFSKLTYINAGIWWEEKAENSVMEPSVVCKWKIPHLKNIAHW